MLDRVDAGEQGILDSGSRHRVRRNFVSQPMRLVDNRLHLIQREGRDARERAVLLDEVGTIGVDLDPVGAVSDLFANRFAAALDAVDDLHAHRIGDFR